MFKCLSGELHQPNVWSDQAVTAIASANLLAQLRVHLCTPAGHLLMLQFIVAVLRSNLLTVTPYHSESSSLQEACWHVCCIILLYYLVFWTQEQMNIISLLPWDGPNSEPGHPKDLFKVHLVERFENFSARVFSQQKICFLKKLKLWWKTCSFFFFCSGKDISGSLYFFWGIKKANISVSFPWNLSIFNYGKIFLFYLFVMVTVCCLLQFWVNIYFLHFSFPFFLRKHWCSPCQYFVFFFFLFSL